MGGLVHWGQVVEKHEKEIHIPDELTFPFFEAREKAIKVMDSPDQVLPTIATRALPFDPDDLDTVKDLEVLPERKYGEYREI